LHECSDVCITDPLALSEDLRLNGIFQRDAIESLCRFHLNHLSRRTDFDGGIALAQVHGIESANFLEMDNVLEIPTYDHVCPADSCQGDEVST
jgi:hypothetical protein